jgi:hypothetical protein
MHHHLNNRNLYVEQSDLRVLCRRCHFLAHDPYDVAVKKVAEECKLCGANSRLVKKLGEIGSSRSRGTSHASPQGEFVGSYVRVRARPQ